MRYLCLIRSFFVASAQGELAYRANFWISLLHSLLNLGGGVLGLWVLFGQVQQVQGWDFPAVLALLGIYLLLGALRSLFIGPSLDALAGMDGEIWRGVLDFTLLRPLDVQFQASLRHWRPLALVDLALSLGVLGLALAGLHQSLALANLLAFLLALAAAVTILYALALVFTSLVFISPGFLFTWVFDSLFQMARYPVGVYPGWLRLVLTWVIPVGVMTTIPAQALVGAASPLALWGSLLLALGMFVGASWVFRVGLRRYASASS
ncbi:MAG: ABC-2 family transporter protein [Chloroflexota bacterium]